jgi:hypothetical protein
MVREHYQDAVRRRGADAGRELRPGRGAMGVMGFSAGKGREDGREGGREGGKGR